jgi:hypothetical protein
MQLVGVIRYVTPIALHRYYTLVKSTRLLCLHEKIVEESLDTRPPWCPKWHEPPLKFVSHKLHLKSSPGARCKLDYKIVTLVQLEMPRNIVVPLGIWVASSNFSSHVR